MMKRLKSLVFAFALMLLVLCILPVQGQAAEVVAERKDEWVLTDDGVLTIKDGDMFTFFLSDYYEQILHVVLEEGVVECPNFDYNFPSLQTVTMPDSVETLGTFINCTALETVTLPSGITAIPEEMFLGCSSLKNVEIPGSVTQIGAKAFSGCSALQSVAIPDGVTTIGSSAFRGCSSLAGIVIPDGVTAIGSSAFENCSSFTEIVLPEGLTAVESGTFLGCTGLETVVLPEGLESIGARAFWMCSAIESINWPESLISIGDYAFEKCTALKAVALQRGAAIGENAFYDCAALETAILPEGTVLAAGGYQFGSCESLKTVTIPGGITEIPAAFVSHSLALEEIIIPDGVTKIGAYAFAFCDNVERIYLPASVKTLGCAAFAYGGTNNIWDREWHVFYGGTEQQWGTWEIVDEKYEGENVNQLLVNGHEVFLGEGFAEYCTEQCVKCSQCDKYFNKDLREVSHSFADGKCTACGEAEAEPKPTECSCRDDYLKYRKEDGSYHFMWCGNCGKEYGLREHLYNGADGGCICGAMQSDNRPEDCDHEPAQYTQSDKSHVFSCEACGLTSEEPHSFAYTQDPVVRELHFVQCGVCGYGFSEDHRFVDRKCVCGVEEAADCKHENAKLQIADDRYHHFWCEDCLIVVGDDELHTFEYIPDPDVNYHTCLSV